MSRIPGSNYCPHIFYMDLENRDLHLLLNTTKSYINIKYPANSAITTIYKLTNAYLETKSILSYPGFLEKWYYFNNILEILIRVDESDKFVSKDNYITILRNMNNKECSAAKFSVTLLRDVENLGSYQLNLSDL